MRTHHDHDVRRHDHCDSSALTGTPLLSRPQDAVAAVRRAVEAMADADWTDYVKGILKGELKRRNVSYRELAEKLEPLGVKESERKIANKLARGSFTAVFFVQCLEAIGCHTVGLREPS